MRKTLLIKGRRPSEQFVQQYAQRIDVAARVDIEARHFRLLGTHVQRRPDHLGEGREQRLLGELLVGRFGDAEIDHLGNRPAIVERDQHIRRLDVAVDDPLLVRMLHGMTDLHEQFQPLVDRQVVLVAVLGDRDAANQFHDEVRAARVGRPGIEHAGDIRVVH